MKRAKYQIAIYITLFHAIQRPNGAKSNKESTASSSKSYGSYKQLTQNQKVYPSSSSGKSSGSNSVNNNNSTSKNNNNENRSSGSIVKTATVKRNSPTNVHQPARSFQYESFHVFNWDEYLKVNNTTFLFLIGENLLIPYIFVVLLMPE